MGKLCTDLSRALPENTISKASAIFQHILHPVKVIAWSYFGTETGQSVAETYIMDVDWYVQ
jgi:hypothetical protein